jgi:hypothetical protein
LRDYKFAVRARRYPARFIRPRVNEPDLGSGNLVSGYVAHTSANRGAISLRSGRSRQYQDEQDEKKGSVRLQDEFSLTGKSVVRREAVFGFSFRIMTAAPEKCCKKL